MLGIISSRNISGGFKSLLFKKASFTIKANGKGLFSSVTTLYPFAGFIKFIV